MEGAGAAFSQVALGPRLFEVNFQEMLFHGLRGVSVAVVVTTDWTLQCSRPQKPFALMYQAVALETAETLSRVVATLFGALQLAHRFVLIHRLFQHQYAWLNWRLGVDRCTLEKYAICEALFLKLVSYHTTFTP